MDARLAPWREGLLQRGFRSGIALPLKDENDNAFGSLTIHSAQPNAFTSEEIRLLEELAGDMAFGIVTLRSRAARERAKQEVALLSFALDKVREGAFLVGETGRYHYANDEGCRVLGYTRAELLGMSVADIDPEFPAERWSDHWRELKTQRSLNFESRHRTRDGRIFPVEVSANYFEYGGRAYNLALVRDITERKRAEEALRRSEVYLAEAQRLSHTGSWALDAASREYSYWSDEMFRIFGVDAHGGIPIRETMGRRIHPEDAGRATAGFEKSLREKVDTSDEYRFVLPDGKVKHIQSVRHPVLNDAGDVVQLVGTFVDITERKRAEEALRKAQADLAHVTRVVTMGELVASIAHEVNQPLTGVVAHAGTCLRWLAAQPPDLEEARHALELIVRDGKRANEVIGRIRGLVKKVPPRRDPMDVNTVILEVIALTTSELQRNHVDLRTHLASHLPLVPADRIQLQQVILNLVVNAIEAMSGVGDRPRELVVDSGEDDSNDVFVEVRDSGPGLDPANLPRLFDSFYTTKPEGMGMGLSISRSIIEAHGGRLQATANLPHGAVFRFTLPAEGDKAP
jgi:PAS domain S-box-containing protein